MPKGEDELAAFLRDIQSRPPDLVFTVGTPAARFMREQGGSIPFVYAMIVDPSSLGLVTGGAVMEVEASVQFEFIRKYFPRIRRVGVVYSAQRNRESVSLLKEKKPDDFSLVMLSAETPEEVAKAVSKLSSDADCLLMVTDAVIYSPQTITPLILQTIQNGLPIIAISPSFVKAGALAAVYPDYKDNGALAAEVAARYFNGESLQSISVQRASRTRTAINLIVARRLRVSVSEKNIQLASEVIK